MNHDEFRQLSEQARKANLVEYFQSSGFTVKRFGSEYRVQEFGLMINPDKGLWNTFYHNTNGKSSLGGNSSIDCLVKVLGKDFKQAVFELTGQDISTLRSSEHKGEFKPQYTSPPKPAHPLPTKKDLQMPEQSKNMRQLFGYMCHTRKIPSEIIEELVHAGLLYQSEKMITATSAIGETKTYRNANAVFVHKDADGKIIGGELQGLNSFKRYKGVASGTGDSAFMFTPVPASDGKIRHAFIFESAIDLMSFYKFCCDDEASKRKLTGCVLVSMAGLKPTIPKQLQAQGIDVVSCVDNDDAGRRFEKENGFVRSDSVKEKLDAQGFKDWNELLVFKSVNPDAKLEVQTEQQPEQKQEPEVMKQKNEYRNVMRRM